MFEEVSPFFAEERRLLHAGKRHLRRRRRRRHGAPCVGSIVVHVMLDYSNLSFISAQSPYVALLRAPGADAAEPPPREARRVHRLRLEPAAALHVGPRRLAADRGGLRSASSRRASRSGRAVSAAIRDYEVYFLNDRGGDLRARLSARRAASAISITLAELVVLGCRDVCCCSCSPASSTGCIATRTPTSGRALLREVRASFYRKLFIAFVAAAVVPVLALALVTRAYIADADAGRPRDGGDAHRRLRQPRRRGRRHPRGVATASARRSIDDNLVVWLSRVIAQDVNIFDGSGLLASSERNLFASGLLPTRTPGEVYRAIVLDGRPSFVGPRNGRRVLVSGRRRAGARAEPRRDPDRAAHAAPAGNRGADRRARSPRAARRGAVHHARRRHRLLTWPSASPIR